MACTTYCSGHCYANYCTNKPPYSVVGRVNEGGTFDSEYQCVHDVTYNYRERTLNEADPGANVLNEHILDLRLSINQERSRRGISAYVYTTDTTLIHGLTELATSINQIRPIISADKMPKLQGLATARDFDFLRIKIETLRKECICQGDCGPNSVCSCHTYFDCGCQTYVCPCVSYVPCSCVGYVPCSCESYVPCSCVDYVPCSCESYVPCSCEGYVGCSCEGYVPCSCVGYVPCSCESYVPCSCVGYVPCSCESYVPCTCESYVPCTCESYVPCTCEAYVPCVPNCGCQY